ncbi:GNAT family N-acetyltransferase [Rhodococcus xishaensis]|uniref:GNAT family N-acetyltransferase n=1 Tax=Rhodococcus xishaensis TaxID=2487364 RepID=A0A438AVP6_9NOCA|nr:GNAT family N-acetyltransferase [Rhodococcus xishaensis]
MWPGDSRPFYWGPSSGGPSTWTVSLPRPCRFDGTPTALQRHTRSGRVESHERRSLLQPSGHRTTVDVVDGHQIDIIRLAWARELGLPDRALDDSGARHVRVDDLEDRIRFVTIAGAAALVGPTWAVERSRSCSNDELARSGGLLALAKDHSGRGSGPVELGWAADFGSAVAVEEPLVSHEFEHVLALEAVCPPDDVAEARLTAKANWFTVVDDDHDPLASAGYLEWQGIIADMGTLTAPAARRRGYGATATQLATNDALDAGLIPQWRAHRDNIASRRLATNLGYEELGTFVSIVVAPSTV